MTSLPEPKLAASALNCGPGQPDGLIEKVSISFKNKCHPAVQTTTSASAKTGLTFLWTLLVCVCVDSLNPGRTL